MRSHCILCAIITFLLLSNTQFVGAQLCTGDPSFPLTPDYVSVIPTTDISALAVGAFINNETLLVEDDLTIDIDFAFVNGSRIRVQPGKQIIVPRDVTLTINASTVSNCGNSMWKQIIVEAGGKIIVENGTEISDAEAGIFLESNPVEAADFDVSSSQFINNKIGISVGAYPNPHPGIVESTLFETTALLFPHLGEKGTGVKAVDVGIGSSGGLFIGNNDLIGSGSENIFRGLEFGIRAEGSNIEAQNNRFENISSTPTGAGIAATDGDYLIAGTPGTLAPDFNNEFVDVQIGIATWRTGRIEIEGNKMTSQFGLSYDQGILLRESRQNSQIINNDIRSFRNIGIQARDWANLLTIEGNHVESSNNSSDNTTGIQVQSPNNQGFVNVIDNEVREMQRGIVGIAIGSSSLGTNTFADNTVVFALPGGSTEPAAGIFLRLSPDSEVKSNYVDGMCSNCTNDVRAIVVENSTNVLCEDNEVGGSRFGFYFRGICTETNMICNKIVNCPDGVTFDNVNTLEFGPVRGAASMTAPAGNCWEPELTALRTNAMNSSDASSFLWHFTNIYNSCQEMTPPALFNANDLSSSALLPIASSGPDDCGFLARNGLESNSSDRATELKKEAMLSLLTQIPTAESPCSYYQQKDLAYRYLSSNFPSTDLSLLELLGVDEILAIDLEISENEYTDALSRLTSFTPSCIQELNYQIVTEAGIRSISNGLLSDDIVSYTNSYTADEVSDLTMIAGGDPKVDGSAVLKAQAMLGLTHILPANIAPKTEFETIEIESSSILYPNPASDFFIIDLDNAEALTVSLFNITGKKVLESISNNPKVKLGQLLPGLYLVRIETKDGFVYFEKLQIN